MAIALISSPSSPAAAYDREKGIFTYKDELTVTSVADSSGSLQLNITGIGALVSVGDYIWFDQLEGADNVDSPVVEITAEAANSVVVDTPYVAYGSGLARLMAAQEFKILTGYSSTAAQPRRTAQTLSIKADPDGIYRVDVKQYARARFNFGEPRVSTDSDYDHQVSCVGYPTAISAPSDIVLLKQNTGTSPHLPLCYTNFRGLISVVSSSAYRIYQESPKQESLVANAVSKTVRYFEGQTIDILLDTPQASVDMTATPGLPTGVSWIVSGVNYTGIRIAATATSAINGALTLNNTSSGDAWQVNIQLYECAGVRTQCEGKEVTLMWWHPQGGWQVYSFELVKTYSIDGNDAVLAKDSEGVRSAVAYEDVVEVIQLISRPESEAVIDSLNTINYSTQVFICGFTGSGTSRAIDLTAFERVYTEGGGFEQKRVHPYSARQFEIAVYKSAEVQPLNQ